MMSFIFQIGGSGLSLSVTKTNSSLIHVEYTSPGVFSIMGADATAYVVLGFPVTREMFLTKAESGQYACANGHEAPKNPPPFCSQCGKPIKAVIASQPTEAISRWADRLHIDPRGLWDKLRDYRGLSEPADHKGLGIYDVTRIATSEDEGAVFALGFKLLVQPSEGSYRGKEVTNGVPISSLDSNLMRISVGFLERHALWMGWEKQLPVQLFLSVYWSV